MSTTPGSGTSPDPKSGCVRATEPNSGGEKLAHDGRDVVQEEPDPAAVRPSGMCGESKVCSGCPSHFLCSLKASAEMQTILARRVADCMSCAEAQPWDECPDSRQSCGHHCECSWVHDRCCWCGATFGDDATPGEAE